MNELNWDVNPVHFCASPIGKHNGCSATFNGCAFVNTSHVTLTTGTPKLLDAANGNLSAFETAVALAFDVRSGRIEITGAGFINALVQAGGSALLVPLEITQAIAEGRSLDAMANALKGLANLPGRFADALSSNDPAVRGAAVAECVMLVGGAASLARGVVSKVASGANGAGKLTIGVGDFSASERMAAQHMADLGNDVVLRAPVGTRAGGGTSDLLVNGVPYDVYTPTTSNPNRIVSAIASKNTQAQGIVLDLSNSSVTPDQLGNILQRVRGTGATNITDIKIIGKK